MNIPESHKEEPYPGMPRYLGDGIDALLGRPWGWNDPTVSTPYIRQLHKKPEEELTEHDRYLKKHYGIGNITQTAGRDLDVLVAEKVLGWERYRDGIFGQPRFITEFAGRENMPQPEDCLEFSTDIAAAWLVAQHLAESGRSVEVELTTEGCHCSIGRSGEVWDNAAPLAICLAALRAVEK